MITIIAILCFLYIVFKHSLRNFKSSGMSNIESRLIWSEMTANYWLFVHSLKY